MVLLNPTDYFLYLPLLPEVAAGIVERTADHGLVDDPLPGVRLELGEATISKPAPSSFRIPKAAGGRLPYDRLVLAAGSVNKLLPIPGVAEHAHGFRGIPEAVYLRDHLTRQIELAANTDDPAERTARCTFVVVGAGYTGTEVAAQGQLLTATLARRRRRLAGQPLRWMLLDLADRVLPELDPRLSTTADRVLRGTRCRGGDGHLGRGGHRRRRAAHRRPDGVDPHAGVVRRRAAPTPSSTASACPRSRAGWSSTSTSPCQDTRRSSRAVTRPPCRT